VEHAVKKQQLLEALSWQGGGASRHAFLPWRPTGGRSKEDDPDHTASSTARALKEQELDVEAIVELLKSLEGLCDKKVTFNDV
jgi:hypothetical protein